MENLKPKIVILIVLLFIGFTNNNQAQVDDDAPIKIDTLLLNIPIVVNDKKGSSIAGLQKEDFIVTQNGERLSVEFFANEDAPISVAIVVDTSGTTGGARCCGIKDAAKSFLKVLRPEDQAMVVSFDGKFRIFNDFTSDKKTLEKAIDSLDMIQVHGTTMYDAIYKVVNIKFAEVKGRKAIILLTDGMESSSRITEQQLLFSLSESDTVIYPILFPHLGVPDESIRKPYLDYLEAMSATTAGKVYNGNSNLKKVFQSIADGMRKQYLIGFYPENGTTNNINIKVNREDVVLRTKARIQSKTNNQENK